MTGTINDRENIKNKTEFIIQRGTGIIYVGSAPSGTNTTVKSWKIFILKKTGDITKKLYPIINGNKEMGYELVWDNKETYIYE